MLGIIERAFEWAHASRSSASRGVLSPTENAAAVFSASLTRPFPSSPLITKERRRVCVNKLCGRYRSIKWMVDNADSYSRNTILRCVPKFTIYFPEETKANLTKFSRWWRSGDETMEAESKHRRLGSFSLTWTRKRKRLYTKAQSGRGRKRELWRTSLYRPLIKQFERLPAAGFIFSINALYMEAKARIMNADEKEDFCSFVKSYDFSIANKVT